MSASATQGGHNNLPARQAYKEVYIKNKENIISTESLFHYKYIVG